MLEFLKQYPFIVGALSGSLAAYLLGLLVSHLRREKRWFGYSVESRNIVKAQDSRLEIKFNNQAVTRLDSHSILLRNTGNRPLVDLPVRVVTGDDANILEHDHTAPEGSKFEVEQPKPNELVVKCSLLNPGEVASVGLTVADSTNSEVHVIARAPGLTVKRINARSTTLELVDLLLSSTWQGSLISGFLKVVKR